MRAGGRPVAGERDSPSLGLDLVVACSSWQSRNKSRPKPESDRRFRLMGRAQGAHPSKQGSAQGFPAAQCLVHGAGQIAAVPSASRRRRRRTAHRRKVSDLTTPGWSCRLDQPDCCVPGLASPLLDPLQSLPQFSDAPWSLSPEQTKQPRPSKGHGPKAQPWQDAGTCKGKETPRTSPARRIHCTPTCPQVLARRRSSNDSPL